MALSDTIKNSVFKKQTGTILGDLFGGSSGGTLISYLNDVFGNQQDPNIGVLNYFYQQLYKDFSPDINGYTLIFFVPPDLSGYRIRSDDSLYSQIDKESYMNTVGKIMTFAAVDFVTPQSSVRSEVVTSRSGGIPIASEVSESDTCSITFIDNRHLDIYMFHHIWIEYIREILEGTIEPDPKYYANDEMAYATTIGTKTINTGILYSNIDIDYYGAIDYAASCYIVKYRPDMRTVTFAGKCVGIFPQSIPNKELIGTRTSNELVTLPFTYSCSGYREALYLEKSAGMWIFDELDEIISNFQFSPGASSNLFGGFLGGVLNTALGSSGSMLKNLTSNASKLGSITRDTTEGVSKIWSSIKGVAGPNGFSKIFTVNK
ncbi:MAG: hypothetical protein WC188_03015 [Candidatus Caldatribacteriota bacterium]|nr:hypothetical protein [Patescibacteria group bacterium]